MHMELAGWAMVSTGQRGVAGGERPNSCETLVLKDGSQRQALNTEFTRNRIVQHRTNGYLFQDYVGPGDITTSTSMGMCLSLSRGDGSVLSRVETKACCTAGEMRNSKQ